MSKLVNRTRENGLTEHSSNYTPMRHEKEIHLRFTEVSVFLRRHSSYLSYHQRVFLFSDKFKVSSSHARNVDIRRGNRGSEVKTLIYDRTPS